RGGSPSGASWPIDAPTGRPDRRPVGRGREDGDHCPSPRPNREARLVSDFDTVLVVDFGAQYAQLIARRVREAHVYSEIVPCTTTAAEMLAKNPRAVILSGGPASVYADGAPQVDPALFDSGV